VEAGRRKRI